MRTELIEGPGEEPLSLEAAKQHLRVTTTAEDALILLLVRAARRHVEAALRRKLITQKWRVLRDDFCAPIVLPDLAPVSAIDAIKYLDADGQLQPLATSVYQLVPEAPARVVLAYDQEWPALRGDREGVRIEVTCGYGGAGQVPDDILAAMLLVIGHLYTHRSDVTEFPLSQMPSGAQVLLSPYIVPAF